jgi:hypothetical protein
MCNNLHTLPGRAHRTPKPVCDHASDRQRRSARECRTSVTVVAELHARATRVPTAALSGVEVRGLQHVVHGLGVHAEGPPDADCRQLTVVNQPVDRHLADSHQRCHFSHRQELRPGLLAVSGTCVSSRFTASRWPVHRRHRNPINSGSCSPSGFPTAGPTGAYQQGE